MKRLLALALFAAASLAHAHGYAVGELKIDHPGRAPRQAQSRTARPT